MTEKINLEQEEKLQLEGRNAVMEALKSGAAIDKLFVTKGEKHGSILPILRLAAEAGIVCVETDRRKLDEMSQTEGAHQGVIASLAAAPYSTVEDILHAAEEKGEPPFLLIADEINDPHNLGSIIRTANCVGAHGVIIPKRRSVGLTAAVAKASAGALLHTKVAKVVNLSRTIEDLKEKNIWVAALDMDGEEIYSANLTGPLAIVVGSEGNGVGTLVKKSCDFCVRLPMLGQVNSLNASVAAAVALYEAVRQRKNEKGM
jgi:23S rRNA (guanosine2251-2'-O)-methyltransferase